jgi:crossover junction endodeoxyribonuclease RusA
MPGAAATPRSWTFDLPISKPLSMNDREHWRPKARRVRHLRQATQLLARQQRIPRLERVAIELHYTPGDGRRRDAINLSATLKPVEDGIVDAGVVPDDTAEFVEPTHPVIDDPAGGRVGRLYVIVREVLE